MGLYLMAVEHAIITHLFQWIVKVSYGQNQMTTAYKQKIL